MAGKRQTHTAAFKAQVALAALKGDRTVNARAGHFGVHPTLIHSWKKQRLAGAEEVFAHGGKPAAVDLNIRDLAGEEVLSASAGQLRIDIAAPELISEKSCSPLIVDGYTKTAISVVPGKFC